MKPVFERLINLPNRIIHKFVKFYVRYFKLGSVPTQIQKDLFTSVGLDRDAGLVRLNEVLKECFNQEYKESNGMFSEHLVLLSALSCRKHEVLNILEIGTFDGKTAYILSKLFPHATISTVDLPDASGEFSNTYSRENSVLDFLSKRNNFLDKSKNINFRQVNSIELANWHSGFDLIWIDGAHGYPVVAMDIINSFRLLNSGGIALVDDIWISLNKSDQYYRSIGGFQCLTAMTDAKLIDSYTLFNKRLGGEYNLSTSKKFVGYFEKPIEQPHLRGPGRDKLVDQKP